MDYNEYLKELAKIKIRLTFNNGDVYEMGSHVIAWNRANYYAKSEYDDDVEMAVVDDTGPLFLNDQGQIVDWLENNMNWEDFQYDLKLVQDGRFNLKEEYEQNKVDIVIQKTV